MIDQRVIDTVETLIHNTTGRIKDVQSNLIPFYNKGLIKHVDSYRMYNVPYMAESEYQTIILVDDLKFKNIATPQAYRGVYKVRMRDAFLHELVHPFLLFVNGKFVKWSNIQIVNDVNYTYIVADNVYYPTVEQIDIIQIPFNVYYDENGNIEPDTQIMFQFDDEGLLSDIGNTIISFNKNNISDIHMDSFDAPSGNVLGWDILNVNDKVKLFPENIILFKDGLLYSEADILIDPMNVISIDKGQTNGMIEGRVFYDPKSNIPKNNVYQFHGNEYISELFKQVQQSEEDVPYYITKLREDFNFEFDNSLSYEENITNGIKYIYQYNPQLLYPAHTSPINIRSWTGKQINELRDESGSLVMLRDKYNNHQTYIMPFLNGELYKWHDQIIYTPATFTLPIPEELNEDDLLEIIYFRNVDNSTIIGHVTKEDPLVSLDGYIERDDLLIYADRHHDMKYPTIGFNSRLAYRIDYTWDKETKAMSFNDDYYYGRELAFVSKNRFVYIGYNIMKECFKFQLSDHFKYCDNQKQFMVFINGRQIAQDEFNITILKNTRPFDDLYIYTAKVLKPGDKLDVFYIPYPLKSVHVDNPDDTYVNPEGNSGLKESGYIYIDKDKLPAPFCKELYMVFVNGKKVANDQLYNINSNTIRITTDIQSTYNVSVMLYRDTITDLISLLHIESSMDKLVNSISEEELNKLNGTFSTITDVEDRFTIDAQKISIINEIVRDFWMKPDINDGTPFLYDYDTEAFIEKDANGNWIIPAMDATRFINIVEEDIEESNELNYNKVILDKK